jgi:hypothetical protein
MTHKKPEQTSSGESPPKPQSSELALLRRCLQSADPAEWNRHFTAYHKALAGKLLAFLSYRLEGDRNSAEGPLQEVFTRLFLRLSDQPQCYEQAQRRLDALPVLTGSDTAGLIEFRYKRWGGEAKRWRETARTWADKAYSFLYAPRHEETTDEQEEAAAKAINLEWPPLRLRGLGLLDIFKPEQQGNPLPEAAAGDGALSEEWAEEEMEDEAMKTQDETLDKNSDRFAKTLFKEISQLLKEQDPAAIDHYLGVKQGGVFIDSINKLMIAKKDAQQGYLPKLRIPTMAFLYQIAANLAKDQGRSRSAQNEVPLDSHSDSEEDKPHASALGSLGDDSDDRDHEREERERMEWSLLRQVDGLLRAPVQAAEAALKEACQTRDRERAEAQLSKAEKRCEEHKAMLSLILARLATEEEMADCLGLTRDQVRYRKRELATLLAPLRGETP